MSKKNKKQFFLFRNKSIIAIQVIATVLTLFSVIRLNLLANKYLIAASAVLLLLLLINIVLITRTEERSKKNLFSKILSLILSLALLIGTIYVVRGDSFLRSITGAKTDTHEVSVVVMKDKAYESLDDVKSFEFGANLLMDNQNITEALEIMKDKDEFEPQIKDYKQYKTLVEDLENNETEVILLNEAHRDIINEFEPEFSERTKVIHSIKFDREVELQDLNTNVRKDTFSFFITGIDTYGPVSSVSRSDVNLIMTVNPVKNQILLTSIPRDYHVALATSGQKDKLTHSGIYGVNESVKTLENLLDMDIDYYIRVNFTSVENIVDAMGGVEVNSLYDFNAGGYSYHKGMNHMDGKKALRFVRERYTLPNGDMDRGRHQQALMTGIINKALSPAILTRYNSILSSVSGSLEMSMPDKDLKNLVKMQQDNPASWDIQQYQLKGYGTHSRTTYSMPGWNLYVMEPDMESVRHASSLIKQMENNELISVD